MRAKAIPDNQRLASGTSAWTGWRGCLRHVGTYILAQAVTLMLTALIAPINATGALAALVVSGSTHAVIDRRWIVGFILRVKHAEDWIQGPYLVGQALHYGALWVAALVAASVTGVGGLGITAGTAAAVVAAALVIERRLARWARDHAGDPFRM